MSKKNWTNCPIFLIGPSSIDYTLRAYTKNENYQACMWSIKSHIKEKFDQKGISIPYPQLDVELKK